MLTSRLTGECRLHPLRGLLRGGLERTITGQMAILLQEKHFNKVRLRLAADLALTSGISLDAVAIELLSEIVGRNEGCRDRVMEHSTYKGTSPDAVGYLGSYR